jgi:20S proteasome alpha/beta subunit
MAIGSGSEGAQTALQEHYKDDLTLAEAEVLALNTLKQVMEEKVGSHDTVGMLDRNSGVFGQRTHCCQPATRDDSSGLTKGWLVMPTCE